MRFPLARKVEGEQCTIMYLIKFQESYQVQQTPEDGQGIHQLSHE